MTVQFNVFLFSLSTLFLLSFSELGGLKALFANPLIRLQKSTKNQAAKSSFESDSDVISLKANNDTFLVGFNKSVVIDVLSNDHFKELDSVKIYHVSDIANGNIELVSNNGQIRVTPTHDSVRPIKFKYSISDDEGNRSSASVRVIVLPLSLTK